MTPKNHHCCECTLLRVEFKGQTCDECRANIAVAAAKAEKPKEPQSFYPYPFAGVYP